MLNGGRSAILDALIEGGPHKGLTLGEAMLIGQVIEGELVDRNYVEEVRRKREAGEVK